MACLQEEVWQQIYVLGGSGLAMALILDTLQGAGTLVFHLTLDSCFATERIKLSLNSLIESLERKHPCEKIPEEY